MGDIWFRPGPALLFSQPFQFPVSGRAFVEIGFGDRLLEPLQNSRRDYQFLERGGELVLHLSAYQSCVLALVGHAIPVKITRIDALAKDQVQGAPMQPPTSHRPAPFSRLGCESSKGVPARDELLKPARAMNEL